MCEPCGCGRPNDEHKGEVGKDGTTAGKDLHLFVQDDLQAAADWAGISIQEAAANVIKTLDLVPNEVVARSRAVNEATLLALARADVEKRYTLAVAWGLDPDLGPASDGHRAVISPDVLEETAWNFMRSRRVGLYHADGTEGHGEVVESYIYRGPDWEVTDAYGNKQLIRSGYWLVGNKWDESAWGLIKRGLIDGLSPQGSAIFKKVSEEKS